MLTVMFEYMVYILMEDIFVGQIVGLEEHKWFN